MKGTSLALLLLALLVLMLWGRRERVRLAVQILAFGYAAVLLARFIQAREDTERLADLALTLVALGVVWLVVWLATGLLERRRRPP